MGKCAALLRPLSLKKARMPPIELCLCCDRIIKGLPWAPYIPPNGQVANLAGVGGRSACLVRLNTSLF